MLLLKTIFNRSFFDGEPDPANPDPATPPEGGDPKKSFTQEEVNAMLETERKRAQERTKKTVADLETLKKSKTLSDSEKTTLQAKIDELQTSLMTKDQLAAREQERLKNQHKMDVENLTKEKNTWQERFVTNEILRSISDAAHANDAFNPEIVQAVLRPITTIKERTGEDGEALGIFEPRVKYSDTDKDGKPVTLDLSVQEAVKRMKDTPEKYGSLFKSTAAGGLGLGQNVTGKQDKSYKEMTVEEYKKHRSKIGLGRPNTESKK